MAIQHQSIVSNLICSCFENFEKQDNFTSQKAKSKSLIANPSDPNSFFYSEDLILLLLVASIDILKDKILGLIASIFSNSLIYTQTQFIKIKCCPNNQTKGVLETLFQEFLSFPGIEIYSQLILEAILYLFHFRFSDSKKPSKKNFKSSGTLLLSNEQTEISQKASNNESTNSINPLQIVAKSFVVNLFILHTHSQAETLAIVFSQISYNCITTSIVSNDFNHHIASYAASNFNAILFCEILEDLMKNSKISFLEHLAKLQDW